MTVINNTTKSPSNLRYGDFCYPSRPIAKRPDFITPERCNPYPSQATPTEIKLTNLLANVIQQFIGFAEMTMSLFVNVAGGLINSQSQPPPNSGVGSTSTPPSTPTPQTPDHGSGTASTVGNSGQFLWKPQSDKDGKLAILLPPNMSDGVKAVTILDPETKKVVGRGKAAGVGNGGRAHFRFNKAGGQYPDNAIVVILYNNGEQKRVTIPDTASRFTR